MLIWDDGIVWWGCQGIRLQGCKIMYILHTCNKGEPRLLSASADCRRACVPEVCGLFRFTNPDQSRTWCLSETDVGTCTILSSLGILFCRWNITRTKVGIVMVCNLKKYMSLCSPRQEPEQRCTGGRIWSQYLCVCGCSVWIYYFMSFPRTDCDKLP